MPDSPATRLKVSEKFDLAIHKWGAKRGHPDDMNWIVDHAKIEGQRAPLAYGRALCIVIDQTEKLKAIEPAQKAVLDDLAQKAVDAFEIIEEKLDEQKCIFYAIQVNRLRATYQRQQKTGHLNPT